MGFDQYQCLKQQCIIISSGGSGNSSTSSFSANNNSNNLLLELLNWKICREDYLLKKVNQLKSDRSISDGDNILLTNELNPILDENTILDEKY